MDNEVIITGIYGILILFGVGLIFGLALAWTAKKFEVKINPLIEKVRDVLPGANCAACGFAGCNGYAEAVVLNEDVAPNLCPPGKEKIANKIAELTNKKQEVKEELVASLRCSGTKKYCTD